MNFRSKLRQLALQSDSEIKKQEILKLCDTLRDDLSSANIIIQVNNIKLLIFELGIPIFFYYCFRIQVIHHRGGITILQN